MRIFLICSIITCCCFTTRAFSQGNDAHLFVCNGGQYVKRGLTTPLKAFFSVSITFSPKEQTSEVLVGSKNNPTIGQRDAMYFERLAFEDKNIVTGSKSDNPETSDYWSLYLDTGNALISLKDIILKADNCIEMGVSTDRPESSMASTETKDLDKPNITKNSIYKEAATWYRKAAEQSVAEAQTNALAWTYKDWETSQTGNIVRYVTGGEAVQGDKFGFVKRVGQCDDDILWITWPTYQKGIERFQGKEAIFNVEVDGASSTLAVDMVAAKQVTPLMTIMVFTNYSAGPEFIDHLSNARNLKVSLVGPTELVRSVDIPSERFSLNGFIANRLKAQEFCEKISEESAASNGLLLHSGPSRRSDSDLSESILALNWKKEPGVYRLKAADATITTTAGEWIILGEDANRLVALLEGLDDYKPDAVVVRVHRGDQGTMIIYKTTKVGYVEAADWERNADSAGVLEELKRNSEKANRARKDGYPKVFVDGWVQRPYLDKKNAILYWATLARMENSELVVNAEAVKLARNGFTEIRWVGAPETFTDVEGVLSEPVGALAYIEGAQYRDYVPEKDTVAAFGVGDLVHKLVTGDAVTKMGAGLLGVLAALGNKLRMLPMQIVGYVAYAVLLIIATFWTIGVRTRLGAQAATILGALYFVISAVVIPVFKVNMLHVIWVIPVGFLFVVVSGFLITLPIVSFILRLIAGIYSGIIRIGIPRQMIEEAQAASWHAAIDRVADSFNKQG